MSADEAMEEHGTVGDHRPGKGFEPLALGCVLAGQAQAGEAELDEIGGPSEVLGDHRVADGFGTVALGLEPDTGASVQVGDAIGLLAGEPSAQHVTEEVVVAVPAAPVIQGDDEQVGSLQGLEDRPGVAPPGHRCAQVGRKSGQDRCLQQEGPDLEGLAIQHLVSEVVDDEPIVTGELRDERRRVVPALQRQRGQLERGDPSLRPTLERIDVRARGGRVPWRRSDTRSPRLA